MATVLLKNVTKIYEGGSVAVKNVILEINDKEFVVLVGPSGCGKTLASYVVAGELKKMMVVVNLGAIVSSKLGETSKNLSKIFRSAAAGTRGRSDGS